MGRDDRDDRHGSRLRADCRTPRGRAACRLSNFQDMWAELAAEDRAWFARWLTELLGDAVLPETA